MSPLETVIAHHKSGKTHPLAMHADRFLELLNTFELTTEQVHKAVSQGRVLCSGILVISFQIT